MISQMKFKYNTIQYKYSGNTIEIRREGECEWKDWADLTEEQLAIDTFTLSSSNQIHITNEIQIHSTQIHSKYDTNTLQIRHKCTANTTQIHCKYDTNAIPIQAIDNQNIHFKPQQSVAIKLI